MCCPEIERGGAEGGGGYRGGVRTGYLAETDLSRWAAAWLQAEIGQLHRPAEGGDGVTVCMRDGGLQLQSSEVHASVQQKRGKRALFYDLTLLLHWRASHRHTQRTMDGVFKLYNVGQDTKYEPGGDKETSYMYELGFPQKWFGPSEPWAEAIKLAAAHLFELAAAVVERWVKELTAKAVALGS